MSQPRIDLSLLFALLFLVACAGPTPTPTALPQPATPVPVVQPTPVPAVPPSAAPLFPQGLSSEPLAVVATAPADKAEQVPVAKEQTKLIVQFNHPVVPLVSVDAQKSLPQPLTVSPAVDGAGEWLNTSTYSFSPAQNLAVAATYTVNVAALQDMLGQSLSGFSWSFKTSSPAIVEKQPEDNTIFFGVTQPITFTFNTEMDRASAESHFSLTPVGAATTAPVAGHLEWQGLLARFVPDRPLAYGTRYHALLRSGAQDAAGRAATANDIAWDFTTARAPAVIKTLPQDGETASTSIRNGFEIDFASPMATNAVTVTIVPTITHPSQYWQYDSNDTILRVQGGWLASRSYTVTISALSETRYGEKLGKDTVVHFTAAPLDPVVSLNTNGNLGMYDANVPQALYVSATNIKQLDYELYRLPRSSFISLSGPQRYQLWEKFKPASDDLLRKWSVTVNAPLNASRLISTTLTTDGSNSLPPGVYYLTVSSPQVQASAPARHILVVSSLNLALKRTQTEALVWATDLRTGKPVSGQPLTLVGPAGANLASGSTDADGVYRAHFPLVTAWEPIYALSEKDGAIVAATGSDWNEGINIWDFTLNGQPEAQEFYANLYTDRSIYRPGQTVYFKGILRRDQDATYSLPTDLEKVPITVRDDQGKQIFNQVISLSRFGTFDGQFQLSDSASIGFYNLNLELGKDPRRFFSSVGFQVAEYRAPEFQVQVQTDKPEYINGDTIKVDANSTYFFGGPVAGAKATWRLLSDDLFFNTDKVKGWWDFTDFDLTADRRRTGGVLREGKAATDAQGRLHFEVPADLKDMPLSQNFTLDVEITDINNQSVSSRTTVPVHKGRFYIGLKPQQYVGTAGEQQAVDVATVSPQGDPFPNQPLTISFFDHQWYSVREKREDGNFYWKSAYTDTLVSAVKLTTDAEGRAVAKFTPASGGVYKVVGEGTDAAGNNVRSATYLWISSEQFVNWRIENNDRIDLVADKKQYAVGDTATVLVPAPFKGAEALMTIERGTIRQVKHLTLTGNSEELRIPITSDMAPNVFVSVMLFKGRGLDSPTPQFKLGYANLSVSTAEKEINVKLTAGCPSSANGGTCQPGDKANFSLLATDSTGKPVEGEFSVALVDKAVQSLVSDTSQSPLQAFHAPRGLGVLTSASLVRSIERLNQQLKAESKGGGGGAAQLAPVRRNFQDTAFWQADLVTDAQGRAQVSVSLPDNLTTWNLTAKGVTAQTLVGVGQTEIVSTKPLLVRPVAPRFFVVGDKTRLEAVVNNNTDQDIHADVTIDARGLTLNEGPRQPLTIKAHDKAKVAWNTVVNPVAQVQLRFSVSGSTSPASSFLYQDALELTLPILRPTSAETVATAGQVDNKTAEQIQLPADADRSAGELQIDVSPSLAAASTKSLDYLKAFSYDCTEQTISKFFPNVVTYQALKKLGLDRPALRGALEATVSMQLQRLYSLQRFDGGWGWWSSDDSSPNITAYALYALATAADAGFSVDAETMNRAERFLLEYLDKPVDVKASYEYNQRAFVLFVLSEKGGDYTGRAVALYDQRSRLDNYGKAYLLMVLGKAKLAQAQALASELTAAAIPSASGTHWEEKHIDYWMMNTNTRSTAIVVQALSRVDPKNALLPNAVRWLMVARKEGHWETTQDTAWSVLGLTEFMLSTGELKGNYTYQVTVNGKTVGSGQVNSTNVDQPQNLTVAISDLVQTEANNLIFSRDGDTGRMYYSAYLRYYLPIDKLQALNRGLLVGRQYFAVNQQTLKPTTEQVSSVQVGDYVQVKLTLVAPSEVNYLVLEDPLPAGFEAVDNTLKTATAAAAGPELKKQISAGEAEGVKNDYEAFYQPYWTYWAHTEVRDDRVAVFATYLGRGTYEYSYLIRAGVAGEFRALPATAWEMYFPDVMGRSAGSLFTITSP